MKRPTTKKRPYFFWDYDLSEEDVREILAGDDTHRKAWVISRILNAARWEDIWQYITVEDIRAHFDQLRFRTPYLRELWAHALEVWSRDGDNQKAVREPSAPYQAGPVPNLRSGILTPPSRTCRSCASRWTWKHWWCSTTIWPISCWPGTNRPRSRYDNES